MIVCICGKCKKNFEMKDEWNGKQVTCPFCGNAVIVGYPGNGNYPQFGENLQPPSDNTAPLVLGICSLILWLIPILGFPVAIAGIVISAVKRYIPGIVMSIIGLVLSCCCFMISFLYAVFKQLA